MNKLKNQEKNSESMHTDKIAEAIGLFSKVIEEGHKKEERSRKLSRKSTQITALISLFSVIATIFGHTLLTLHGESVQRRYEQAQEIQERINKKEKIRSILNKGAISIRKTRAIAKYSCKNGKYIGNLAKLEIKRKELDYNLVEAGDQTRGVFSGKIADHIRGIITLEEASSICTDSPKLDEAFKVREQKYNTIILKSIQKDKKARQLFLGDNK